MSMRENIKRAMSERLGGLSEEWSNDQVLDVILTAMREPSEEMTAAASEIAVDTGHGFDTRPKPRDAENIWKAMIDAALAPSN